MALPDSKTLKSLVEFRHRAKKLGGGGVRGGLGGAARTCRFCGSTAITCLTAAGNVCANSECQQHAQNACLKMLPCGHRCHGIRDEDPCLPCLYGCAPTKVSQDADDMCMICFTEALSATPTIQISCGHMFHLHCCRNVLENRWVGPRITFGFFLCPLCKSEMNHPILEGQLSPIRSLYEDVRRKALVRLEYEGHQEAEAITAPGRRFHQDPSAYAMERYAYYVCFKCNKAYYSGEARCAGGAAGGAGDALDPAELICGGCSDVARVQKCPKHNTDFLEYKCRYCCLVAIFFCFGNTHFCNACHDDVQRVTNMAKSELPHRPAGPKCTQLEGDECPLHVQHPPTGEEFALGCGVCSNVQTF